MSRLLSRGYAQMRHLAKRVLGRPSVPPPPASGAGASWYDEAYQKIPEYTVPYWHSHYYASWTLVADRVRRAGLRRVVDIGCGPGQFAGCLFDLAGITDYDGLDFSAQAVAMARTACPRGRFHVDDATQTRLCLDTPHDIVICMEVLEHVPNDGDVIGRFAPGVRAICTVPNFEYPSHVRHFTSVDQVVARYGRFFDAFDVLPMRGHYNDHHVFYIMDGVRNATV